MSPSSSALFLVPYRSPNLVGRSKLLHDLKDRLFAGGNLALFALRGLPGVGKTALAAALAYDPEVRRHFRDGVLWAGLGREADPISQFSSWGTVLGMSQAEISNLTTIDAWAKAIARVIAMGRMLLVVDDAWKYDIAIKFVGGPNCACIVTTRSVEVANSFTDTEGVIRVTELNDSDGSELLSKLAPNAVKADPDAARELVKAVGGLPLAINLMGKYLNSKGEQPRRIQTALDQLHHAEDRLKLEWPQAPSEQHPSIPLDIPLSLLASIRVSEQALSEKAGRVLQALSVFPSKPDTFSENAALAIAMTDPETLDELEDSSLLERSGTKRYTLHQT